MLRNISFCCVLVLSGGGAARNRKVVKLGRRRAMIFTRYVISITLCPCYSSTGTRHFRSLSRAYHDQPTSGSYTFLRNTHGQAPLAPSEPGVPLCPVTTHQTPHPSSLARTNYCPFPFMSHAYATASSSSSTNFQLVINNALDKYKKRTKNDLTTHPLAAQIQSCNSPSAILAVLQQQVQGLDQSRSSDERWSKWLDPTVNVIYVLSSTLAAGVSLVRLSRTCLRSAHSNSPGRYFLLRMSYSLGSAFSFQCVSFFLAIRVVS